MICDLDGVVYRGGDAVEGSPAALRGLKAAGLGVVYATNNASRPPEDVVAQLTGLGAPCEVNDVVTSAQAGASHLAGELPPAARVLALGGPGVFEALRANGLTPVAPAESDGDDIDAVLQGLGRQLGVTDFEVAARHLSRGVRWVATNLDATFPLEWGMAPGNGAYVELLASTTGATAEVVGKPFPPLYRLAADRLGTSSARTLAVGDRLDTDIAGAGAAGLDSVWVLTGVDHPSSLFAEPDLVPPTHVVATLAELLEPDAVVVVTGSGDDRAWVCGDVVVRIATPTDGHSPPRLQIAGPEGGTARPMDAVRAGIAALLVARDDGRLSLPDLEQAARSLDALVPDAQTGTVSAATGHATPESATWRQHMTSNPQGPVDPNETGGQRGDHVAVTVTPVLAPPERQRSQPPATPPRTGDVELDAAMGELARAQVRPFAERIDSGERVHRLLQGRLGDLGRA